MNLIPRRGLLLLGADNADAHGAAHARALPRRDVRPGRRVPTGRRMTSSVTESSTSFSVRRAGAAVGTFEVPLLGAYNVRNALAAIAVGAAVGLSTDTMAASLKRFKGVRRRMQHRGTVRGRRGLRRLRAPSDRHRRNARGRPLGLSEPAHLGDLRAAIGDVVPPRVPGGLRQGTVAAPIASSCRPCSARRCLKPSACRPSSSWPTSRPRASTRATFPSTDDIVVGRLARGQGRRPRGHHVERRLR